MACLRAGRETAPVVVLVHGNVSSSVFWLDTIQALAADFHVLAPDLRGFGQTEAVPIVAANGLRDWSEDLHSLLLSLGLKGPIHWIGWSLGGGIIMQYAMDHPDNVRSLVLISPLSPYGFGGTKDEHGKPNYDDFAGSGGGTVNAEFIARLQSKDRSGDDANSPRTVMNQFYFHPPFRVDADVEEQFVDGMLSTQIGSHFYPGSSAPSDNWPGISPGADGVANAMSPRYVNLSAFIEVAHATPVLWIRGEQDRIVSDASLFDFGFLGKLGAVPGWPGDDVYPAQPMVSQTRTVLDAWQRRGGQYEEFLVSEAGHSPHIEQAASVLPKIREFLAAAAGNASHLA